jgi:uncharacterized protein YciI
MALFVAVCLDKPGAKELRAATRDEHLAYLRGKTDMVKLGGAYLEDGSPVGSMLVIEAEDRAAVEALMADDPYAKAGVFASTEIRAYRMAVGGLA